MIGGDNSISYAIAGAQICVIGAWLEDKLAYSSAELAAQLRAICNALSRARNK